MDKKIIIRSFPTIIVILGATGDLMTRKIVPAFYNLYVQNKLPKLTHIIGFSRREIETDEFRELVRAMMQNHDKNSGNSEELEKFINLFSYQQGTFTDNKKFKDLATRLGNIDGEWKTCANKLFYLAVPPEYYENIFHELAETGLTKPCGPNEGWTRVLVEKPFGKNAHTAQKLDELLGTLFKEEQIYRIDHYLAKEMMQNIINFRFTNNLFEKNWNAQSIEKVEIRLWETLGVEKRGKFYDGIGALRDMGQNHLLQMLALVTMKQPLSTSADSIRVQRALILSSVLAPNISAISDIAYRSQYSGYQQIKDVDPSSTTETYFKIKLYLDHPDWKDVPFILESGKRMKDEIKEIIITFKHPSPCLCPSGTAHLQNKIVFAIKPKEGIFISFFSKKPGVENKVEERKFDFLFRENNKAQYVEEYEKLLLDAILGDQTLFVSTDEVKEMWRIIDPIIETWSENKKPLNTYTPHTNFSSEHSEYVSHSKETQRQKKDIIFIGLGKMGGNLARQLIRKNWNVVGYNRTLEITKGLEKEGLKGLYTLSDLNKIPSPKIVWVMLPSGQPMDDSILGKEGLINILQPGDIIIDGSNSFYEDTVKRAIAAKKHLIEYLDVGVSGGPGGALNGASCMVGGDEDTFKKMKYLLEDLSVENGVAYMGKSGAGHFVKMVHNGIEYGMMQSIAEGFELLKKSEYQFNITQIADIYNHGTVIESHLLHWLKKAYEEFGENLDGMPSTVSQTGEGKWTVETAEKIKVLTPALKVAVDFRTNSAKNPSYTGKVLSALRRQFGGHTI